MRRFPRKFLIEAVGVSLAVHVILVVILGSVVVYVAQSADEPEFEALPVPDQPVEPLQQKVYLQKNQRQSQKPPPLRIVVQQVTQLNPPQLQIALPEVKASANYRGYGSGSGGLGKGFDLSATIVDIKAFGTTKRLDHAFKGTIRTFSRIDRLRQDGRWFIGEDMKRRSKHIYNYAFNLPEQPFEQGFPGVTDQFEWFSLDFEAELHWPAYLAGEYEFRLTSDDGSIFMIDGQDVIDNDGLHGMSARIGRAKLEPGKHHFRLVYFQGPRVMIGLILEYRRAGEHNWQIFDIRKLLDYQPRA